jgi:hypothetical protein
MDERQGQVVTGAGLQDSRINEEFVAFLNKWGPRLIYALLIVVLAYLGWGRFQDYQQRQVDQAFAEYQAQLAAGNPDVLLQIADEHDGKAAVWTLATLDAADILLRSARTGVRPSVAPSAATPADLLDESQQAETMQRVAGLYQRVIDRNAGRPNRAPYTLNATWGLASAQLSLGENDAARRTLESYVALAEDSGFTNEAEAARGRLEVVGKLAASPIPVYKNDDLPEEARRTPTQPAAPSGMINIGQGGIQQSGDGVLNLQQIDPAELSTTDRRPAPAEDTTEPQAEPDAGDPIPPADDPE